jgi:hypothetical protein
MKFMKDNATQTCPRRFEGGLLRDWPRQVPLADVWTTGHGLKDQEKIGTSCSYCGSLHPDVLLARLKDGWHLEGSDKSYKWYLAKPYTTDELIALRTRWEMSPVGKAIAADIQDKGGDLSAELDKAYFASHALMLHGSTVAKFYTHHLKRTHCEAILTLWKDKQLNHSMYVRPAFPAMSEDAPAWVVT